MQRCLAQRRPVGDAVGCHRAVVVKLRAREDEPLLLGPQVSRVGDQGLHLGDVVLRELLESLLRGEHLDIRPVLVGCNLFERIVEGFHLLSGNSNDNIAGSEAQLVGVEAWPRGVVPRRERAFRRDGENAMIGPCRSGGTGPRLPAGPLRGRSSSPGARSASSAASYAQSVAARACPVCSSSALTCPASPEIDCIMLFTFVATTALLLPHTLPTVVDPPAIIRPAVEKSSFLVADYLMDPTPKTKMSKAQLAQQKQKKQQAERDSPRLGELQRV